MLVSASRKPEHCIGIGLWTLASETAFGLWTRTRNVSVHIAVAAAVSVVVIFVVAFTDLLMFECLMYSRTHAWIYCVVAVVVCVVDRHN